MPFKFICNFCKKSFLRKERSIGKKCRHVFCSSLCYHNFTKTLSNKICEHCDKSFYPGGKGKRTDPNTRFCSVECYKANKKKIGIIKRQCLTCKRFFKIKKSSTRKNCDSCKIKRAPRKHKGFILRKCRRCKNSFKYRNTDIARGLKRHYCSEECRRPPLIKICKQCENRFRDTPSNNRIFCSFRCYRQFSGETRLEKTTRESLNKLKIKYIQEFPVKKLKGKAYLIDFYIPKNKIALEVDGKYWHNSIKDFKKDLFLKKRGFKVCRITDKEIRNAKNINTLIKSRLKFVIRS